MEDPLISIIIPVYNTGKNLIKLVKKILSQEYGHFQLILVDDGSTDNSLEIITAIQKSDSRVVVAVQKNSGPAAARNTGLKKAQGKYVMFLDSDDDIANNYFEKMLGKMSSDDYDLAVCGLSYRRRMGGKETSVFTKCVSSQEKKESTSSYLVRLIGNDGRLYGVINKVFRRKIILDNKIQFREGLDFGEDLVFVLDYLKYAEKKICFVYEPLYIYNFGTETSTVSKSSLIYNNWQKNWDYLKERFGPKDDFEQDNLNWVRYRWHYSYCLAVIRSDKKKKQKLELFEPAKKDQEYLGLGRVKNIGWKKKVLEFTYLVLRKSKLLLWLGFSCLAKVKGDNTDL